MFIDTHTHLYLDHFANDLDNMMGRAVDLGVRKVILPNIDSSTTSAMNALVDAYPDHCFPLMGLHPCSVNADYLLELRHVRDELNSRKYWGIGEVGMDLYWDKSFRSEQEKAFRTQIKWSRQLGLPIIIHSREALDITIDIISDMQEGGLKGIFHCFTGTIAQAKQIMDVGFHMGIGGVITFKNTTLREVVMEVPMEYIMLETDSPYLTPHPHRGKRNESSYVTLIAQKLAEIKKMDIEEVAEITGSNAVQLFQLPVS